MTSTPRFRRLKSPDKLGADEGEVDSAIQTLVPVLLGGLQHNSQDPEHASKIESAASSQAASGLLDAGGGVDQVDESDGHQAIAALFGGNDTDQVAAALAKGGAGNSDLLKSCCRSCCRSCWPTSENSSPAAVRRARGAARRRRPPAAAWATCWAASSGWVRRQIARQHPRQRAGRQGRWSRRHSRRLARRQEVGPKKSKRIETSPVPIGEEKPW